MKTDADSGRGAWILVGPTATGKTAVANELARLRHCLTPR